MHSKNQGGNELDQKRTPYEFTSIRFIHGIDMDDHRLQYY